MTERESIIFKNVKARAQLTTAGSRACTYYTKNSSGSDVFVKGPYPSKDAARVSLIVNEFKKMICSSIVTIPIELKKLIPDGMPDCQFGFRMNLYNSYQSYWFQVAPDILALEGITKIPTILKTSAKAWQTPVVCVDWKELEKQGCFGSIPYHRNYQNSIYTKDPEAAKQLVMHTLLSWSCGCGADIANRNFLYFPKKHRVYQVDLETWCKTNWDLTDAGICNSRTEKASQMRRFIDENWTTYFQSELENCQFIAALCLREKILIDRPDESKEKEEDLISNRLARLCDHEEIKKILPLSRKTKRSNDPPHETKKKERTSHQEDDDDDDEEIKKMLPLSRKTKRSDDPPHETKKKAKKSHQEDDDDDDDDDDDYDDDDDDVDDDDDDDDDDDNIINNDEEEDKIFIGKALAIHRHSIDPWGNEIDVVKSNFQKCIRLGKKREALYSFFSCYNMETIFPYNRAAKALRTNIINRLIVCVCEDVGVANVPLVLKTLEVAFPMSVRETTRSPAMLAILVYDAAGSKKSRIQSHMYHAYAPENAKLASKLGLSTKPPNMDDPDLSDPTCFALVGKNDPILWEKIEKTRPGIAPLFKKAYTKAALSNKRAFLQCALAVTHFSIQKEGEKRDLVRQGLGIRLPDSKLIESILKALILNKFTLIPIPQAFDTHTKAGRQAGASKMKFKEEGAIVTNPHGLFIDQTLEKIYKASKK